MLGLGRALGETMAALMVIGSVKDTDQPLALRRRHHRGVADRQRAAECQRQPARVDTDPDRAGAVRHHAGGERSRAPAGLAGGARAGWEYARMITQAPNYTRRKWADRFMRGLTVGATHAGADTAGADPGLCVCPRHWRAELGVFHPGLRAAGGGRRRRGGECRRRAARHYRLAADRRPRDADGAADRYHGRRSSWPSIPRTASPRSCASAPMCSAPRRRSSSAWSRMC